MDAEMFVNGDSEFLTVLLTELLENACKYRKPGGKAHVQIGHTLNGFLVRDNGIGMETKYAAKIFLPFERLHRDVEYPGTGIGLANVKRIVDRHGGSISVESEPGKGSTFYVELPSR
jgi:signal transduction histidine kinase